MVVAALVVYMYVPMKKVIHFLDAPSHLYKKVCPSVRSSVGPSPVIFEGEKYAY